jgi:hypothetical protein
LHLSATLLGSGLLTFVALFTTFMGPAHVASAIRLYFDASSKVAAGITNTPWATPVDASTLVEAFVYHVSYFLMPGLVFLIAMYLAEAQTDAERQRQKQIIGVVAGAAAAASVTFLRADVFHLYGPSFLVGALFLSCAVVLPGTLAIGVLARWTLSAGFLGVLVCCIIVKMAYGHPTGFANPVRSIGRLIRDKFAQAQPPVERFRALAKASDPDLAFVLHRMIGEAGPRGNRLLTADYPKIVEIVAQLRKTIGHRKVVFNGIEKNGDAYISTGLIYFLGGFRVISDVTEPRMSIWLMSDYRRWQKDLVNSDVDCLVTTAGDVETDPMVMWFISRYPTSAKTTFQVSQGLSYSPVCRQ